ncbi:MAG: uroporphyrinogen-III C-methyltransferase [Ruminococcus sp.]|nr:uroporphyrinogen-III C-methyltransferase [Ruminococcus sp.]
MIGRVYLVGAGCGDFDLITLRGMRILEECDTVVYDSLIDERLLDFAPAEAEKICVGKRSGHHSETQENINEILAERAAEGKAVVRLKGGDPFVFGRGGEEAIALRERGIPYSIVPGITSAIAAPELAGIPATHRRISRSFHVITGHTADDTLTESIKKYAQLDGTLVFLMSLKNLRKIAEELISGGMSGGTPTAVISCGCTADQRVVRDSLSRIADKAEEEEITAPAVIVVGETVRLDLSPNAELPLKGTTVTATGTIRFTEKMAGKLTMLGADVKILNTLNVPEYRENPPFDTALRSIEKYSMIALTSMNGAEIFLKRMRRLKIDVRRLSGTKFAAIGSGTAEILEKHGIYPNIVPEKHTTHELGCALTETAAENDRILILRAENGSHELTDILDRSGLNYDDIKTYNAAPDWENTRSTAVSTDFIIFASASGTDAFFELGCTLSPHTKIICIGEVTAKALVKHDIKNFRISKTQSVQGIIDEIIREV